MKLIHAFIQGTGLAAVPKKFHVSPVHHGARVVYSVWPLTMGWTVWSLNPSRDKRIFCSPKCPNWLELTTHLYLVPKIRMSGTIPLLPLHAFMACTGKTTFPLTNASYVIPT